MSAAKPKPAPTGTPASPSPQGGVQEPYIGDMSHLQQHEVRGFVAGTSNDAAPDEPEA
ncbi:MAG: hypothetical protein QM679_02925 [Patulibacter sp.]